MTIEDIKKAIDAAPEFEGCPVTCLGHTDGNVFWFLSASGSVLGYTSRQFKTENIEILFAGDMSWLVERFPATGKDGSPSGYSTGLVRRTLIAACFARGFFHPDLDLRGPGAWRDDPDGLIIHCGDRLLYKGKWRRAGIMIGNLVYPLSRPEPRPSRTPANVEAGRRLLKLIKRWNWQGAATSQGDLSPIIYLGWLVCAFIPGALTWRPHILIAGGRGTGKTKLLELGVAILGEGGVVNTSDSTAAGVRQTLNGSARAVMLDEIEKKPDDKTSRNLQELARIGSSDGQGAVLRGSASGVAQSFLIRSCFLFSAILHDKLLPQDASRITKIELRPLHATPDDTNSVTAEIKAFKKIGPRLRARAISNFQLMLDNMEVYKQALSDAGATTREGDQFSAFFAAFDILISDQVTPKDFADRRVAELMPSILMPDPDEDGAVQCLNHLLSSLIEVDRGTRRTVGELIGSVLNDATLEENRTALERHGIKIVFEGGRAYFVVANNLRGLTKLFAHTRWEGGVWPQDLKRLPSSDNHNKPLRFAGTVSRGTWLPSSLIPMEEKQTLPGGELADITNVEF